jgi:hypothetical protein
MKITLEKLDERLYEISRNQWKENLL